MLYGEVVQVLLFIASNESSSIGVISALPLSNCDSATANSSRLRSTVHSHRSSQHTQRPIQFHLYKYIQSNDCLGKVNLKYIYKCFLLR